MTRPKFCRLALSVIVSGLMIGQASATTITQWNFENDTIAVNNSPAPSTGVGTASSIGMTNSYNSTTSVTADDVIAGANGDTGGNGASDLTQVWRIRGQSPGNGWSSQAPIGTQGAVFAASTVGYSAINVSFDWYLTNQAPTNMMLEYSNNGGTTWVDQAINIGSDTPISSLMGNALDANTVNGPYVQASPAGQGQEWLQGLTATINDPLAANNPNFEFELVNASTGADVLGAKGGAYNNNSGNWRFDNITISGTAVPVPEPSSVALLLIGGAGLVTCIRRKRS